MDKLFTQEAVNTALKVCVLASLGLGDPEKLNKELDSLPKELVKMVMATIAAGCITLLKSRASKTNLEQEFIEAIKKSQTNKNSN